MIRRNFETKARLTSKKFESTDETVKLKNLCKNIRNNVQGNTYSSIEIGGILLNTSLADQYFLTKSSTI